MTLPSPTLPSDDGNAPAATGFSKLPTPPLSPQDLEALAQTWKVWTEVATASLEDYRQAFEGLVDVFRHAGLLAPPASECEHGDRWTNPFGTTYQVAGRRRRKSTYHWVAIRSSKR